MGISIKDLLFVKAGGGGGGSFSDYLKYAGRISLSTSSEYATDYIDSGVNDIVIDNERNGGVNITGILQYSLIKTATINAKDIYGLEYSFMSPVNTETEAKGLTKVTLNSGSGYASSQSFRGAFQSRRYLETIDGAELDFTSANNVTNIFYNCNALKNVRFRAKSIKIDISLAQSSLLSNETLISIANGLDENASGKILTLHSTSKENCDTLIGENNNGTFVATESGPMSLTDFITNIKGWTLV